MTRPGVTAATRWGWLVAVATIALVVSGCTSQSGTDQAGAPGASTGSSPGAGPSFSVPSAYAHPPSASLLPPASSPPTSSAHSAPVPPTSAGPSSLPGSTHGSKIAPPVPPRTPTVQLGATFSPSSLSLRTGETFVVRVSPSVTASGSAVPATCPSRVSTQIAGGMLAMSCTPTDYQYTALRAGTTTLTAGVHPRCQPGSMCPDWATEAQLHITIT